MVKRLVPPLLLFCLFFAGMALVQFSTPDLPDNDGFYHIKMAWLMRTEGLKPDFPWLPLSVLNEREFYDHHFLFHVALIPFTLGDLRLGAKWAAVAFASLAFLAAWLLLKRQQVPLAWLWALGLLGVSSAFLFRMSIPRAQSLSLAVLALGMLWLLENRLRPLAVLAFLYVWLYNAFPLLLVLAVLHMLATLLIERRLELRLVVAVGLGTALGVLVNPYFPFNLIFAYRHMLPKLVEMTAVRVGNEWFPYDTTQLVENALPALAALALGALALGLAGRKMETRTAFSFLVALMFAAMLFQARRFVEYFPPFALIFAAFAWSPLLQDALARRDLQAQERAGRWKGLPGALPAMLLALAVLGGALLSLPAARDDLRTSKPYDLYAGASAWLQANTPAGERVFQTDWDDFPRLFYYNTHNTYLIGLDPTYLQLYNAGLYDLWVQVTRGDVENLSQVIPSRFAARYIHTDLHHTAFLRQAAQDPGLKEVYRDDQAVVFEVLAP
jgi:hypothetical protein